LCDKEESDGRGEHVRGDAREVIGVILVFGELFGIELAGGPVVGEGDGDH
jgi:hypothetical protein